MRKPIGLIFLLAGLAAGELRAPLIGYVGDEAGGLRPVVGVGGSFLVREAVLDGIRSFAFAGSFGLIQAGEELLLVDQALTVLERGRLPAAESLLAVSGDGRLGIAYLPATEQLCRLAPATGSGTDCVLFPAGGIVRSAGPPAGQTVSLAVERAGQLWLAEVQAETGRPFRETLLPGVAAPVLLLTGRRILYSRDGDIILRDAEGSETRIPAPVPVQGFEAMGSDWARLRSASDAVWAVRVAGGALELYRLPWTAR